MRAAIQQAFLKAARPAIFVAALMAAQAQPSGQPEQTRQTPTRLNVLWTLAPCERFERAQLDSCVDVIAARLEVWGAAATVTSSDRDIEVKMALPDDAPFELLRRSLTTRGGFAMHDVIDAPSEWHPAPEGYEQPRWGGEPRSHDRSYFVKKEPVFTPIPSRPPTVNPPRYENDVFSIAFPLSTEDRQRFAELTSERVGKALAMLIDGEVWSIPVVQARIFGDFIITVDRDEDEAWLLASLVAAPPLSVCLEVRDEREIDEPYVPPPPEVAHEPVIDPDALVLFNTLIDGPCDRRVPPKTARIRFRAAATMDPEAVVEYLWRAPDTDRVRTTISCLRAASYMNQVAPYPMPAEQAIEFFENYRTPVIDQLRRVGHLVIGLVAPVLGDASDASTLMSAVVNDPHGTVNGGEVDVVPVDVPRGSAVEVRGIEGGQYEGQRFCLVELTSDACIDSVAVASPELDMRMRMHRERMDGRPMITHAWLSTGIPGDAKRNDVTIALHYRQMGASLIIDMMSFVVPEGNVTALELLEIETDVDLSDVDWTDEIELVDQDALRDAERGYQDDRLQKLRKEQEQNNKDGD